MSPSFKDGAQLAATMFLAAILIWALEKWMKPWMAVLLTG